MTKDVVVVPHTHWDREWYRTFQAFRLRLVEVIDRVLDQLDSGALPYFLLDGQTVVLDDYLAIRPEQRERLTKLIRGGKLGVGPWYVLPDEFLVSGESLLRNLLFGRRRMREFGAPPAPGYLPDMFGHVGQMPQILRGFGMERAVVWRGVDPLRERFWWRAPSGARIATTFLPTGYCNVMLWDQRPIEDRLDRLKEFVSQHAASRSLLLSGCDHLAPNRELPTWVAQLNARQQEASLQLGTLAEGLIGEPEADSEVVGELRQGGRAYLLPGVLSTRMPLKQANAEVQTLWERYVEPLTALVGALGAPYVEGYWREGWTQILLNHPHDSICGCSTDAVHREMQARFSQAQELGEALVARSMEALSPTGEAVGSLVYNPLGHERSEWVPVLLEWPRATAPTAAHLVNAAGAPIPCVLESVEEDRAFYADVEIFPDWRPIRRFRFLALVEDMPAMGTVRLFGRAGEPEPLEPLVDHGPSSISNEHLRLFIKDGALHLEDLDTGAMYPDVHAFVDGGDAGDEYTYSPPEHDRLVEGHLDHWQVEQVNAAQVVLRVVTHLKLPEGLIPDRQGRSYRNVSMVASSRFTLRAGARQVEVETELQNKALDHRLRLRCGTGLRGEIKIWSENPFWVTSRQVVEPAALPVPPLGEARPTTFPQLSWSALESDYGLMIANVGLPEAEVTPHPEGGWDFQLTLLRSVGWLSRDDLRTRGGGAGPSFETPEAQCQGFHRFRYALIPYRERWEAAMSLAHGFVAPPRAMPFGGAKASLAKGLELGKWLVINDERLVVSTIKRAEAGRGLTIRVYNPTRGEIETMLSLHLPHRAIALATMAEEPQREIGSEQVLLRVGSGEIVTLVATP